MNNIALKGISQVSHIECEEYFPLRVVYNSSIGENRFVGFYNGETNLLEFAVDRKTNLVNKIQVVICKDYKILDTDLILPSPEKAGAIYLSNPEHNNCDTFTMSVYTNCIKISLSPKMAIKFFAMGQVLFGVDEANDLTSVTVTNLTSDEISHTISELQAE